MATSLDKNSLTVLTEEIEKALSVIAEKHNLNIKLGRGTFTQLNAKLSLEISTISALGNTMTKERVDFMHYKSVKNIPFDLDTEFIDDKGNHFKVIGYLSRARTYPIELLNLKTKTKHKASISYVVSNLR